jgi:hypothetical protein
MEWEEEWEDWKEIEWETVVKKKDKREVREVRDISQEKEISSQKKTIASEKKEILSQNKREKVKEIVKPTEFKELKELKTFANNLTRGGRRVKTKSRSRETEILLYMRKINESNENIQPNIPETPQMCLLWNSITWSYSPIKI